MILGIFGIFGSGIFYVTITGNFDCFQYFNFETNFLKNENLFLKKTWESFCCWKYYDWKSNKLIQDSLSKWTCHKEHSFASIYFFFETLFQYKNLLWRVDLKYQLPKYPCSYFMKAQDFYLRVLFPCEYP